MSDGKTPRVAGRAQRKLARSGGPDPFYGKLCEDFYENFTYRDPKRHPGWTFTPEQQALAMNKEERSRLRRRIVKKLQKVRDRNKGSKRTSLATATDVESSDEDEPAPAASRSVHEQGEAAENSKRASTALDDIAIDLTADLHTAPELDGFDLAYYESDAGEQVLNDMMDELTEMGPASWAQVNEKQLQHRQARLPSILHQILGILGRATGAEIHLDALWHDGRNMQTCSASTERLSAFADSEKACEGRSNFLAFVREHLERQILKLFFEYLWVWQGGCLPILWERLERDGLDKSFSLIQEFRLPAGIRCLRNPDQWDQNETNIWATALRNASIPAGSRFQFLRPRPGVVDHETRMSMHPESHLVYQPESLLYVRRLMAGKAAYETKWEGLPVIPTSLYKPLTETQLTEAKAAAIGHKQLADLLNYLPDYETYGPYQATRKDWTKAASACAHLKSEPPSPAAGIEYLVHSADNNGSQLPTAFFNSTDHRWDLGSCLKLVTGGMFLHARTGTYMAGPYGFKWIVLLLVHLHACSVKIRDGLGPVYDGVCVEWPRRGTADVDKAILDVHSVLKQSVEKLFKTSKERAQEMTNLGEAQQEFLPKLSEQDVGEAMIGDATNESKQQKLVIPSGAQQHRSGFRAPQSTKVSQKHALAYDDDEDILWDDDEPYTPKQSPTKRFKAAFLDVDEEDILG
ncbi:hypothetical protein FRC07_015151 [Ceratobasidium sp. 392]|nr:hypothetical protein FRC07_015151 [Ceratobasidium sp. 392]